MYNLKNIIAYIQGNIRYKLFYSRFNFLLRNHVAEQISWRISIMDKECFSNGSCKLCGCETTALQMANKPCEKPCYPSLISKEKWEDFKKGWTIYDKRTNRQWTYKGQSKKVTNKI